MKAVTGLEVDFVPMGGHRDGTIEFKRFFTGEPDTPGCYEFSLTRLQAYSTPRHTHNHDQVRFCLKGPYNYGHRKDIPEGWVCYHPESAPYGPQRVETECLILTLQMGGAGGHGFMTYDQVDAANRRLRERGEFRNGVYFPHAAGDGERGVDGWEAVWRDVHGGEPPAFASPRYAEPILINPDAFDWVADPGAPGVDHRPLGVFTERGLAIGFTRLGAGAAHTVRADRAPTILYVLDGSVRPDAATLAATLDAGSAILVEPGDAVELTAAEPSRLYRLDLAALAA